LRLLTVSGQYTTTRLVYVLKKKASILASVSSHSAFSLQNTCDSVIH